MSRTWARMSIAVMALASAGSAWAVDLTANIGYNSEYIFRGIPQKSSSAMGGLDLTAGGFYAGTWGADVGDGLEIDYYGGYNLELGDFILGAGFTWYTYTDDFDDEYLEANLKAGWKFITFDAAIGEYDNFGAGKLDYEFYSVTVKHAGFWGKVGTFENDFDGSYYEGGYGNTLTINEVDLFNYAVAVIYSDSTLLGGDSDTNLVFTLSKAFTL